MEVDDKKEQKDVKVNELNETNNKQNDEGWFVPHNRTLTEEESLAMLYNADATLGAIKISDDERRIALCTLYNANMKISILIDRISEEEINKWKRKKKTAKHLTKIVAKDSKTAKIRKPQQVECFFCGKFVAKKGILAHFRIHNPNLVGMKKKKATKRPGVIIDLLDAQVLNSRIAELEAEKVILIARLAELKK